MNAQGLMILGLLVVALAVVVSFFLLKKKTVFCKKEVVQKPKTPGENGTLAEKEIVIARNIKYLAHTRIFICEFTDSSCQKYGYMTSLLTPEMEMMVGSGEIPFLQLKCEKRDLNLSSDIARWLVVPLEEVKAPKIDRGCSID